MGKGTLSKLPSHSFIALSTTAASELVEVVNTRYDYEIVKRDLGKSENVSYGELTCACKNFSSNSSLLAKEM